MKPIGLIFFFLTVIAAQLRIGDWAAYTSPLFIRDMVEVEDQIVCATEGGLLIYDKSTNRFNTLTNIDGLVGTNLATINIDNMGNLWIGGGNPDGFVQIYDLEQRKSLAEFDYDLSEVNRFAISDSIIFGVYIQNQDWGLIEFILEQDQFIYRDVYKNWPESIKVISGVEIWEDSVYIGTDQGLFVGNWRQNNLKDPNSWLQPYGQLTAEISTLHRYNDELILASESKNIYVLDLSGGGPPQLEWDYFSNRDYSFIDLIQTLDGQLWGILSTTFIKLSESAIEWQIKPNYKFTRLLGLNDGSVVAGTHTGLAFLDEIEKKFERLIPNAPLTNHFSAITVLSDGRIVAGSKYGLAIKEDQGWRNIIETTKDEAIVHSQFNYNYFAADTVPVDFGGFIADLEQGPDGFVYCAIRGTYPEPRKHGGGIIIIDVDNPANFTLIDTALLDYFADEYMVVMDLEFDRYGNLWVADAYATTKHTPIQVRNTNGMWGSYATYIGGILSPTPNTIAFDAWDRVWVGAFRASDENGNYPDGGLAMLTYSGNPVNPDESQWTKVEISPDTEYTNRTVWSLAITSDNKLYVLTPTGLFAMDLQFSNTNPVLRRSPFPYFPNISFGTGSKIRLDRRANVWTVSPSEGIHVLLNNATYWPDIEGIKKETTLLLSNEVSDIAFDHRQGKVYITTNRGINAFKIPFANEQLSFDQLKVFPSPFHIPSDKPLIIDGLKDESSLIVMTLTGQVIRRIMHKDLGQHGYQIRWDGRDEQGRWIGSGVYLLSVYNPDGDSNFTKITVIRH